MSDQITDATIAEIQRELAGDGVWIDPQFAASHGISRADEARIEKAVASAEMADIKVVLTEIDMDDERFQGSVGSLSAWLHDDVGGDATYVGWERYSEPHLRVISYGDQPDVYTVDRVAAHEHPKDLAAQVVRVEELLDDGNAYELWQEMRPYEVDSEVESDAPAAEDGSSVGTGAIVGVVLALIAVVAGVAAWRRRRDRRAAGFALPTTVLHTIREAEDRRLRQQAEAETLALGESIGRNEPIDSPAALASWQQALDHYAAARSILSQPGAAPADVIGALVLTRRGKDARAAAQRRGAAEWQPTRPCWFNPLHAGPTSQVTWRDDEDHRHVEVPACRTCAAAVREDREPDDVLDFIRGERTVHYFRLDLGPWSRTGYGSLEPDLLGALREGPRRRNRRR